MGKIPQKLIAKANKLINSKGIKVFTVLIVVLNIFYVVMHPLDTDNNYILLRMIIAYFSAAIFFIEYIVRIWIAPQAYPHRKPISARLVYIFSFMGLIDFLALLPFISSTIVTENQQFLTIVDMSKLFLIFKVVRFSKAFKLLRDVLVLSRQELVMALSISAIILIFSSLVIYYVENAAQPEAFGTVSDGLWWAVITFATVGYGDLVPITTFGKMLAMFISIVGIGMIALPTAIISSSLMEVMKKQKTHKDEKCPHCGKKLHS